MEYIIIASVLTVGLICLVIFFLRKKRQQLSETVINIDGKIIEPKEEEDFTLSDFINLLNAGAKLLDAWKEYEKEKRKNKD